MGKLGAPYLGMAHAFLGRKTCANAIFGLKMGVGGPPSAPEGNVLIWGAFWCRLLGNVSQFSSQKRQPSPTKNSRPPKADNRPQNGDSGPPPPKSDRADSGPPPPHRRFGDCSSGEGGRGSEHAHTNKQDVVELHARAVAPHNPHTPPFPKPS